MFFWLGQFFLFLGLRESLHYDFSPSEKIKFAFKFLFLFYVPSPWFRAEKLHFYMYFCWKIILFHHPKIFHISIFIPTSPLQLFKKSPINLKIKNPALTLWQHVLWVHIRSAYNGYPIYISYVEIRGLFNGYALQRTC